MDDPNMDNEVAVIGEFKKALRKAAQEKARHFDEYPLGPQDRATLADDIWATYDNFAIVESKASQAKLGTEAATKTARAEALCKGLQANPAMASLHAQCHRIAWRDDVTGQLMSREYRGVVCGKDFPGTCSGMKFQPEIPVDDFADGFFGEPPANCLPKDDFQRYVAWLTRVITGKEKTIAVLASSKKGQYTVSSWMSLQELSELLPTPPTSKSVIRKGLKR